MSAAIALSDAHKTVLGLCSAPMLRHVLRDAAVKRGVPTTRFDDTLRELVTHGAIEVFGVPKRYRASPAPAPAPAPAGSVEKAANEEHEADDELSALRRGPAHTHTAKDAEMDLSPAFRRPPPTHTAKEPAPAPAPVVAVSEPEGAAEPASAAPLPADVPPEPQQFAPAPTLAGDELVTRKRQALTALEVLGTFPAEKRSALLLAWDACAAARTAAIAASERLHAAVLEAVENQVGATEPEASAPEASVPEAAPQPASQASEPDAPQPAPGPRRSLATSPAPSSRTARSPAIETRVLTLVQSRTQMTLAELRTVMPDVKGRNISKALHTLTHIKHALEHVAEGTYRAVRR